MEQSTSKIIGKLLQLVVVVLLIIGFISEDPAPGGIGVLVGFIGRIVETYWDDWFD